MRRLYLQFYVTIILVLAVFVGATALLWRLADDSAQTPQYLDIAAELKGNMIRQQLKRHHREQRLHDLRGIGNR